MVNLKVSTLILALCGLGVRAAAAAQEGPENQELSILDLARDGTVTKSGTFNVTYKHSLPEPNRSDSFEVDGVTFYRFPEDAYVDPGYWEERNISVPAVNGSSLDRRQSSITSCEPCKCSYNQQVSYEWQSQNWNTIVGNTHQLSDSLCPPGSISKTYTKSWSYSLSVQGGPDLGIGASVLKTFGIGGGFSYTWGNAVATAYGVAWTTPGQQHPFIETFRPNIYVVNGIARATYRDHYYNNKVCSVSDWSHINLHLPLVNKDNNDCQNSDSSCGADGTYDSCFFIGKYATLQCPGRNLGPTPVGRECPNYLYPSPYNKND
ncbi:unnamed protein product [Penicillium glandicola]